MHKIINDMQAIIFNLPEISLPMDTSSSRIDGPLNRRKHIDTITTFDNIRHIIDIVPSMSRNRDRVLLIINHIINKFNSIP